MSRRLVTKTRAGLLEGVKDNSLGFAAEESGAGAGWTILWPSLGMKSESRTRPGGLQ